MEAFGWLWIILIRRTRLAGPISGQATLAQALGGKLLGVAALRNESGLERSNLAVEQIVGLVDEANEGVGADRRVGMVEPRA